jgi:hypothetical protein
MFKKITMALSLVSMPVFAGEITHANFVPSSKTMSSEYAVASSSKGPENGFARREIKVSSGHRVSMTNPTDRRVGFHYIYTLCVDKSGCIDRKFDQWVEPHTNFQDAGTLEGHVAFAYNGEYTAYAKTQITCDIPQYADEYTAYNRIIVVNDR